MARRHVGALQRQRSATLGLLTQLTDDLWDLPCDRDRRVREVVAHLIVVDAAVYRGRLLRHLRRAGSVEELEVYRDEAVRELAQQAPSELIAALERSGERLVSLCERIPGLAWQLPVRTLYGRHPLSLLLARRMLDEWFHMVDVARAAKPDVPQPIPCPGLLATAVLDALPSQYLPRVELSEGVVRLVVSTAPRPGSGIQGLHRTWSADFARREYGPRVTRTPDATVSLHSSALALLTSGRSAEGYGPVSISGDRTLADRLLEGAAVL